MRLLNHVYGFGAKHELLRAGIFGRVASRCLLSTFVGATKCCLFMWWSQHSYSVSSSLSSLLLLVKNIVKFLFFLRAQTTTFVLLSCEEANWNFLCNAMGSSSCCWRQQPKTEELYTFFLIGVSNFVCLMWILCPLCEAKVLQSPLHRVQSRLRKLDD